MIRVDVPKLRGKMAEKGFTITSISDEIGVNRNTFSGYLEHPEKMTYSVIAALAELLCDSYEEACKIFFAQDFRVA